MENPANPLYKGEPAGAGGNRKPRSLADAQDDKRYRFVILRSGFCDEESGF